MAYSEASKNATLKYREKKKIVKLVIDMPEEKQVAGFPAPMGAGN